MEGTVFSPALEGMKHVKSEDGAMLTKPFLDVCKLIIPVIVLETLTEVTSLNPGNCITAIGLSLSYSTPLVVAACDVVLETLAEVTSLNPDNCITAIGLSLSYSTPLVVAACDVVLETLAEVTSLNPDNCITAIGLSLSYSTPLRLENKYLSDPTKYDHLYTMVQEEVDAKTAKGSSSCTNGLLWLTRAMDFLVELFRNLIHHLDWSMCQACTDAYGKTLKKWHGWLASSSFSVAMKLAPDRKKFLDVVAGTGDANSDIEKFCTTFSPFLEENHKFLASIGLDDLKAS